MVTAEMVQHIYVQVVLGTSKAQAPFPLNDEESALWDEIAESVAREIEQGYGLDMPECEVPDLPARINPVGGDDGGGGPPPGPTSPGVPPGVMAAVRSAGTKEDGLMPFGIRKSGDKYEVFNSDTGKAAQGGLHDSRAKAVAHQRALMRNVSDAEVIAEDLDPELQPQPGEHFHAIGHIEGESTGLRTFTNLSWRDVPFAYHWQKSSSAHGGTPVTVQVGLVNRALRDPHDESKIHMFGALDLDDDDGVSYARKLVNGFARWVSIGLDETMANTEIEWDEADGADEDPLAGLTRQPKQVRIDGGRIGELTGVSVPAQADATVEPTVELVRLLEASAGGLTDAAAAAPSGDEEDEEMECPEGQVLDPDTGECMEPPKDAGAEVPRVRYAGPLPPQFRKKAEEKKVGPDPEKESCPEGKTWDSDAGECVSTDADADGGEVAESAPAERVKFRISRSGVSSVREPVRELVSPSGDEVTMADVIQGITAAAYRIEIPDLPPKSWYDEPTDVEIPGAFCVTDDGRIYGVLAPLNTNHRAYATSGRRMTVPNRNVDYSRFLGGEALTSNGRISGVGPITMDCGHASRFRSNHDVAPDHYENACSVVGKARVGETADGLPWIAGALEPGVTPDQLSRMLACRLSGDWQPHPEKPGWQELVACLLVPAPGFPMGRSGPTVEVNREGVLVASSMPVNYVGDGGMEEIERVLDYDDGIEAITAAAASAGSDDWGIRARRLNQAGLRTRS